MLPPETFFEEKKVLEFLGLRMRNLIFVHALDHGSVNRGFQTVIRDVKESSG